MLGFSKALRQAPLCMAVLRGLAIAGASVNDTRK
jgi:hypothetical protein